jgi:hypothetical protein
MPAINAVLSLLIKVVPDSSSTKVDCEDDDEERENEDDATGVEDVDSVGSEDLNVEIKFDMSCCVLIGDKTVVDGGKLTVVVPVVVVVVVVIVVVVVVPDPDVVVVIVVGLGDAVVELGNGIRGGGGGGGAGVDCLVVVVAIVVVVDEAVDVVVDACAPIVVAHAPKHLQWPATKGEQVCV